MQMHIKSEEVKSGIDYYTIFRTHILKHTYNENFTIYN